MQDVKTFTGETDAEVWQQLEADWAKDPDPLEYRAILQQAGYKVLLDIDIDPGGGFEGGIETTSFSASFDNPENFRFGLHHESFLDEVGKFLGMQDIETGDARFDANVAVKSSDEARIKAILANETIRLSLVDLEDFSFGISLPHGIEGANTQSTLELSMNEGITDLAQLRSLYIAFFQTLLDLAHNPAS
jgi:hypothetical protein